MPSYRDGDEGKFFPAVIAGLLALGFGLGFLIYSLIGADPDALNEKLGLDSEMEIEEEFGVPMVDPGGGLAVPSSGPNLSEPVAVPS
jgi:hypothetical protein